MVYGLFRDAYPRAFVKPRFHIKQEENIVTQFYAQPYSLSHRGFYFDSLDQFNSEMERLIKNGCEEFEILFIDGESHQHQLAESLKIGQADIEYWFTELEDLTEEDANRLCFLVDHCGYTASDALEKYDSVCLFTGSAEEYAEEILEDTQSIPEYLQGYIDYRAFGRDMTLNGEIIELNKDLLVTNPYDF